MSMSDEERRAIIKLKLAKADTAYREMLKSFELSMFSTAANRLYYALFYASSAILVKDLKELISPAKDFIDLAKKLLETPIS